MAERAIGAPKSRLELAEAVRVLEAEMFRLADELKFEEAARVRDRILEVQGKAGPASRRRGGRGGARPGPSKGHGGRRGQRGR